MNGSGVGPFLGTSIREDSLEEAGHREVSWVWEQRCPGCGNMRRKDPCLGKVSGLLGGLVSKAGFSLCLSSKHIGVVELRQVGSKVEEVEEEWAWWPWAWGCPARSPGGEGDSQLA